ncbi:hypothetical protein A2230_09255 [candidate division WOR-1 bacterium RIFOXYA2_FULL_36_21]|uniref:Uncharacterized protein n=1 Tax=candidate division WOR-1 bacterium RIFOXYB2_FULL_36_35 TaxID=1802578 RepID=A0A1F4S3P0_UNCSA|nr:MAG: hypothetical protein A2230_09255 [candidate division WOR-1 bacterium RIFOXYA2_FULL_36_21]OGC15045.1 MAG: hypothetical protein A2290_09075 [candidate division WOR-1 bacterium RIFOXYB2_FULL_36_35]OGC18831.1 MAG: hypothetical protein A2282_05640 [candidate division WOR-1 bacterium RIFOXYA12_FULL_36_13]
MSDMTIYALGNMCRRNGSSCQAKIVEEDAKNIYNEASEKFPADQEKIDGAFIEAANLDGDDNLSPEEAQIVADAMEYYGGEVESVLSLTRCLSALKNCTEVDDLIKIEVIEFLLENGCTEEQITDGTILLEDGGWYVNLNINSKSNFTIGGISLSVQYPYAPYVTNKKPLKLRLYFDGNKHTTDDPYLSINIKDRKIYVSANLAEELTLSFGENNPFIDKQTGSGDFVVRFNHSEAGLSFESYPAIKIIVSEDRNSYPFFIENGSVTVKINKNYPVRVEDNGRNAKSTPSTIVVDSTRLDTNEWGETSPSSFKYNLPVTPNLTQPTNSFSGCSSSTDSSGYSMQDFKRDTGIEIPERFSNINDIILRYLAYSILSLPLAAQGKVKVIEFGMSDNGVIFNKFPEITFNKDSGLLFLPSTTFPIYGNVCSDSFFDALWVHSDCAEEPPRLLIGLADIHQTVISAVVPEDVITKWQRHPSPLADSSSTQQIREEIGYSLYRLVTSGDRLIELSGDNQTRYNNNLILLETAGLVTSQQIEVIINKNAK